MFNGKATLIILIVRLIKKHSVNAWICFRTKIFRRKVEGKLDFSNYATKVDLKNATGVDKSKLAKKVDLANSKFDVDKLDIDKLKNLV